MKGTRIPPPRFLIVSSGEPHQVAADLVGCRAEPLVSTRYDELPDVTLEPGAIAGVVLSAGPVSRERREAVRALERLRAEDRYFPAALAGPRDDWQLVDLARGLNATWFGTPARRVEVEWFVETAVREVSLRAREPLGDAAGWFLEMCGISERRPAARVLRLRVQGLSNKDVAAELHVSPKTVESHVAELTQASGMGRVADMADLLRQRARGLNPAWAPPARGPGGRRPRP